MIRIIIEFHGFRKSLHFCMQLNPHDLINIVCSLESFLTSRMGKLFENKDVKNFFPILLYI